MLKESSIKYLRPERRRGEGWGGGGGEERGGLAKSVLSRIGEESGSSVSVRTPQIFLQVCYKVEIKYELFRQPKLSIPISPVQLESTTSIPRALLGVLIRHFPIALDSSFFVL